MDEKYQVCLREHQSKDPWITVSIVNQKQYELIQLIINIDFSELDRIMYYDDASKQYSTAYDEFVKVLTKCQEVTK